MIENNSMEKKWGRERERKREREREIERVKDSEWERGIDRETVCRTRPGFDFEVDHIQHANPPMPPIKLLIRLCLFH